MNFILKTSSIFFFLICFIISGCAGEDKPVKPSQAPNEKMLFPATNIFQPSAVDPALVRQSMQARSEYEDMNRKINARMTALYEENPEIKELQAKMRELQKKIDALLAEDEELSKLKKKQQSIAPEIPAMPRKAAAQRPAERK